MTDSRRLQRKLAAILYADVAGYSRLTGEDEEGTHRRLSTYLDLISTAIDSHRGRVVHYAGDAVLADFDTVTEALGCAVIVQRDLNERNRDLPDDRKVQFRIGVNLGEVIVDRNDIYGDGVNVAARLEGLAEPGGVCVSEAVRAAVGKKLAIGYEFLGERRVKNIAELVRGYRVVLEPDESVSSTDVYESASSTDPPPESDETLIAPKPKDEGPSIAVVPFKYLGGESGQDFIADGLRYDIMNALVKISGIFTIAPSTANAFANTPADQAGRAMGVRYILEGNVRSSGQRARVGVDLTDTKTNQVVWSERYDRIMDDSFAVQDEITEKVVTALDVKLVSGEQARIWRKTLKNPKAREHFYCGIQLFFKMTPEAMVEARQHFETVARMAPEVPLGPTMVSFSHWWDAFRGWTESASDSLKLAGEWAEKAIAMEDADGLAHAVMSHVLLLNRKHDEALAVGKEAVARRPNCVNANGFLGNIFYFCDLPNDAITHVKRAMRHTPMYPPWFVTILAASYKASGDLDKAIAAAKEAIRLKPNDVTARLVLASAFASRDWATQAQRVARDILGIEPSFSLINFGESQPFKNRATLERLLDELSKAGLPD